MEVEVLLWRLVGWLMSSSRGNRWDAATRALPTTLPPPSHDNC